MSFNNDRRAHSHIHREYTRVSYVISYYYSVYIVYIVSLSPIPRFWTEIVLRQFAPATDRRDRHRPTARGVYNNCCWCRNEFRTARAASASSPTSFEFHRSSYGFRKKITHTLRDSVVGQVDRRLYTIIVIIIM
jgi:hypothetical protein